MHEFLGHPEKPAVFNNLSGWMTAISVLWPQFYLLIILFLMRGGRPFRLVFQKLRSKLLEGFNYHYQDFRWVKL